MAEGTVWSHADGAASSDGDTGWLDASAFNHLDVEIEMHAATVATGDTEAMSTPNISFYLEGQAPSGDVEELWQAVFYQAGAEYTSVGPGDEVNREVPAQVRLRWTLGGSHITYGASILGR